MKEVTILMAYYENPTMLAVHLHEWMRYRPDAADCCKFVIVDDGSQESPAAEVIAKYGKPYLDIALYRVLEDKPWGQDGARNIGMHHLETEWALMTDMDHVLDRHQVEYLLERNPDRKHYYMPYRMNGVGLVRNPHPNSFLMHRHDFWRMGGYDEDFVGFYGSDGNFRKCCKGSGLREIMLPSVTLNEITTMQVADCNTRKYSRKEGEYYAANNPYLNAKRTGPAYRAVNPLRTPFERLL